MHEPWVASFELLVEIYFQVCSFFMIPQLLELLINLPNVTITLRFGIPHLVSVNAPQVIHLNRQACWLTGTDFARGFQRLEAAHGQTRLVLHLRVLSLRYRNLLSLDPMRVVMEIYILDLVLFLLVLGHLFKGFCCVGFTAVLR